MARQSLLDFVQYVKHDYRPAWFHKKICEVLQEWAFGKITRLMLFMPPQHGKSELASRKLPAWILGKDPNAKIISASYGFKFAKKMNRSVQRVMTSPEYREIFPETKLFGKNVVTVAEDTFLKNSEEFEIVGHSGSYMCTGVGGSVTGNTMTHGIIDDPIRGRKDAESKVIREGVHDWYDADFWTRQAGGSARILIMNTRWNEDDLSGYLLKLADEDHDVDQWTVLSFPAEATIPNEYDHRSPGQWLWPERYPNRFYKAAKAKSPYDWQSLYQQNPHNDEYAIFSTEKMHKVDVGDVDVSKCALYGALDPSKGGNDFAALITIAVLPDGRWLVWECNLSVDVASTSIVKLVEAQQQYNYKSVWIEANAWEVAQSAWNKGQRSNFEIVLKQEQAKAGIVVPYVPVWHNKPKPDRIRSLEAHFNNGQLAFREDWAKCYRELINQFRIFPDKNAHDDGPDAIEMLVAGIQNRSGPSEWLPDPDQIPISDNGYNGPF